MAGRGWGDEIRRRRRSIPAPRVREFLIEIYACVTDCLLKSVANPVSNVPEPSSQPVRESQLDEQ
jgi:hypothetical protein